MVEIKITQHAQNCLDFFKDHPYYGNSYSKVIVDLTREWLTREGKTFKDAYIDSK